MSRPKLTVSVSHELLTALDNVVGYHHPFLRRHAVHHAALQLGLSLFEAEPSMLSEVLRGRVFAPADARLTIGDEPLAEITAELTDRTPNRARA